MKIEKLPSGSYRVRKYRNNKTYSLTWDHKPSQREIEERFLEILKEKKISPNGKKTFYECATSYIESKSSILSPASIREYNRKLNWLPDDFTEKALEDISQIDLQSLVNQISADHSPKTTSDYSSFILSVISMFNPGVAYKIALPQKISKRPYIPKKSDLKVMFKECAGTPFEIPIKLGCYGLRRSEICALTVEDIDDNNVVHITKAMVQDKNKKWIIKTTKTTDSTRTVLIDPDLADQIRKQGYVYDGFPGSISNWMRRIQEKNGLQCFSLHKLRHYFVTILHDMNIPDHDIMRMGGWSTDNVMKTIYRHEREETISSANTALINHLTKIDE